MKKTQRAIICTGMLALLCTIACNPFDRNGRSMMNHLFSGNEKRIVIRNNDRSLEINYSGDIVFNDEETAIEKMSPGGYLDYKKDGKRLYAESRPGGNVVYEFYNNGDRQYTEDDNGKTFLAEAIQDMISQGLFIDGRMERLYREGGIPLLLAEVRRVKADNAKKRYLEYMLQTDNIEPDEMTDISNIIGKTIASDNEKRSILEKIPAKYLVDTSTAEAYFAAIGSISSDNDKANALKKTLKQPLSDVEFDLLLQVALTISSDNDKADLLRNLIRDEGDAGENSDNLLNVINSISSDNDKASVLATLIEKQVYTGEPFERMLGVIEKISSDNDKANVLKKLAKQNIVSKDQWISIIRKVPSISSDNDKANVLLEISKKMPGSDDVITAYRESSKAISSDHDYQRALKAVQ